MWLRIYQHLLPNAKAWRITIEKTLRQFFEGLTGLPEDVVTYQDEIYSDLDPQQTRELDRFDTQFGLPATNLTEQQRRDRLDGAWSALGGQSPRYIQDTLQAAGFDVYVQEWWDPAQLPAAVARNPLLYLNSGTGAIAYTAQDAGKDAQDGDPLMQDGGALSPTGYALVNKILVPTYTTQDGAPTMQDGSTQAMDGGGAVDYQLKVYRVPTDPNAWPYFLYIGGETFPDHATVPSSRRNEFETLCLKICPAQQWLGILVDYS